MHLKSLVSLLIGLIACASASAQSGAPSYAGEVCLSGSTITVNVTASPVASAILIYPNPPGGGYYMSNDGSGNYSASFNGINAGTSFRFHLVIQIPQQFEFAPHVITVEQGCTAFSFSSDGGGGDGGDGGDGGGGGGGGGGDSGGPLPIRGFRHDLIESNGTWSVQIETATPRSPMPAVTGVRLHHRVNGGPIQTQTMSPAGNFIWRRSLPGVGPGDKISYYFTETIGQAIVDTAWFERTVGEAAPAEPDYPIVTVAGLRFRDRHENEWRFDHYPAGYDVGRTFDIQITDHGNRLDIDLVTAPEVPVPAVDIKWYSLSGPLGFCDRNISAISMRMGGGNGVFYSTIDELVHGQRVDIEFTLLAGQTYYSEYIYYYVGDGRLQQKTQNPLAYAAGDASISAVTVKQFAFNQHAMNLPPEELRSFMDGKILFETRWDDGLLFNPPTAFDCNGGAVGFNMGASPAFTPGLLGPRYTNNSCIECHMLDGRGRAPASAADTVEDYLFRLSIPGEPGDAPTPHPLYGVQLDTAATPGTQPEGSASIVWETVQGAFDDGTPYELRRPAVSFTNLIYGEIGSNIPGDTIDGEGVTPYEGEAELSVRIAPMLTGLGLLEAVSDAEILAYSDPVDADGDGVSGRVNYVENLASGGSSLGRFGWKAGQPNLRQQAASAFAHDMGMSSSVYGDEGVEVSAAVLDEIEAYLRGLTLPPRENYDDPAAFAGKALFETAGCAACHRPAMRTASDAEFAPYRDQLIQPFTDLLLHDMGEELADNRPEFGASGREWRTAPLWAIGYVGHALGTPTDPFNPNADSGLANYLHDGRARTLLEAILWHGGEAEASRDAVLAMDAGERAALVEYVKYPFIDPADADAYAGTQPCNAGDLALPFGVLDLGDIAAFIDGFVNQSPASDLAAPAGVWDLQDVSAFIGAFSGGCP